MCFISIVWVLVRRWRVNKYRYIYWGMQLLGPVELLNNGQNRNKRNWSKVYASASLTLITLFLKDMSDISAYNVD